ncbi:MAG: LysR family transcriptional regulator [Tissierellia bacterium]|nr:LysR family transcriptional regulator [Tissierellia bacterium]
MFTNKNYVYEVYKAKSFSKAAENLFISQPSLSLTIKKIENRIGSQLFDRSTTPIQLTDCGEEYIRCIEKIMDIEDEFEMYLSDLNNLQTGNLAIGAGNFFASYILPPLIAKFKTMYPRVAVNLVETNTAHLEKLLYSGDLDLIIDNYNFNETLYKKQFFYREQMILLIPEKFPCNTHIKKYRLSAEDIIEYKHFNPKTPALPLKLIEDVPFILLRYGNDTRDRADKIFAENGVKPNIELELDQLATAFHVSCHGIGATMISDTLVREVAPDHRVFFYKIDSKYAIRENYFYFRISKYHTRAMQEFLNLAAEPI